MEPSNPVFARHGRQWRDFLYAYPVISRRSKGLSIGVNLNPDQACNYDCVYCQVDRTQPPRVRHVDLATLELELRELAGSHQRLFEDPEFAAVPSNYRRINDFAFSGDGEPTASPHFPEASRLVARVRSEAGLIEAKIVLITNACFLTRPTVSEALSFLDQHNGEIWAKLDAGTEPYYRAINRTPHALDDVVEKIASTARVRPIVIQSMFLRLNGAAPDRAEIRAYLDRLRQIRESGGQIKLVQVYSVARRTPLPNVERLTPAELQAITHAVQAAGFESEAFP